MKKTLRFLSMAALVFMGAAMVGCTSNELVNEQPANNDKKVTLTTTVSMDVTTKALTSAGVKSFAEGEKMAVIYYNGTSTVKAESKALETGDLIDGGRSAKFTFELENPNTATAVKYIYPAAMANNDGSINYDALATQNGTLATLSSNLDLATKTAAWKGTSLPTATLDNQLAILAITLKNNAGTEITGKITNMTISDGTYSYNVNREAAAGPIYVAIRPTSSATISIAANNSVPADGIVNYTKSLSGKTYLAGNGYNVSWKMDLPVIDLTSYSNSNFYVTDNMIIKGTPTEPAVLFINFYDGNYEVTLDNLNATGSIPINIFSSYGMNIKLKGTSMISSIRTNSDKTLTIDAAEEGGEVIVSSGYTLDSKTVTINGGTLKVKNTSDSFSAIEGNLLVNGGAVYLDGGVKPAVSGSISAGSGVNIYGWNVSEWSEVISLPSSNQYISTDNSAAPSTWTW